MDLRICFGESRSERLDMILGQHNDTISTSTHALLMALALHKLFSLFIFYLFCV